MNELSVYRRLCDRIGVGLLACTGASLVSSALLSAILYIVAPTLTENIVVTLVMSNLCTYIIAPAVMLAVIWRLPMGALPDRSVTPKRFGKLALEGVAMIFGLSFLTNGLIYGISALTGTDTTNILDSTLPQLSPGLAFLFLVIIAPVFEEYIFRHLLLRRLLPLGQGVAVVVSAAAFGLFHSNLYQFFYATGLGIFFGCVTVKTGQLRWTIALHAIMNLVGGVIPLLLQEANEMVIGIWGCSILALLVGGILLLVKDWRNLMPRKDSTELHWRAVITSPGMIVYALTALVISVVVIFVA